MLKDNAFKECMQERDLKLCPANQTASDCWHRGQRLTQKSHGHGSSNKSSHLQHAFISRKVCPTKRTTSDWHRGAQMVTSLRKHHGEGILHDFVHKNIAMSEF